tara:strand:+ start:49 stop:1101 length:1053 start_codon:yes stop_codon:yes gene_type:complete
MKKILGIVVLSLLLISNIAGAKTKDIGNGLKINIPKKYKHFEIDLKKIMSAFPIIKEMIDENEIDKDEFESFGIGPKAKLLVLADNQKPITILKKLFTKGGLEKLGKDIKPLLNKYVEKYCRKNDCEKLSKLSEEEQAEILIKIYEPMWPELIFNKWKLNKYTLILIGESLSDDYIEEIESGYEDYQEKSEEELTELLEEFIDEFKEEIKEEIKENENASKLAIPALNSFDLIKLKVGRSYKNELYIYGIITWNIPDYEIDGKSEFIFTIIDKKIFATVSTCYRNCFDTNNFFSEILEPTNLLKNIEKKGIIEIDDSDGLTKQLKDLNELYKSGVLTKEEFKKAKKKILN